MSRYQLGWVALLATGFLSGCASSQMSRIDINRELYETWPLETRQAILDGKVEPGMTPDMVKVAWGRPTEVVAQSSTGDEIWVYKKGGDDGSVIYPGGGMSPIGGPTGAVTIGTSSRGGTVMGTNTGIGMGGSMGGIGVGGTGMGGMGGMGGAGTPIITRPTPPEIREVVFRNGVVVKADAP